MNTKVIRTLKFQIIGFFGFLIISSDSAFALINLKQVKITDKNQIELMFDAKVNMRLVSAEYFNDIIQINLNETAVYPAKISSITSPDLKKIFAYQYTPKLVRTRLTVNGKAESYQHRLNLIPNGKQLTVRIGPASDQILQKAAAPEPQIVEMAKSKSDGNLNSEEKTLLQEVMKKTASMENVPLKVEPVKAESKSLETRLLHREPLASGKPLPSPMRSLAALSLVVGLLGFVLIVVRKIRGQKTVGIKGMLGKYFKGTQGGKMIEVVANHYLGPKKSIVVVKIQGKMMVLGVSDESINLISQISGGSEEGLDIQDFLEPGPQQPAKEPLVSFRKNEAKKSDETNVFSEILTREKAQPMTKLPLTSSPKTGVRAQIRNRMEQMKPL